MVDKAKHPVKATEKTLQILELLKELDRAGISELSDRMDIGKSAVHNHLSTLHEHEYITKADGQYRLGLKFLALGGYTRSQTQIVHTADPELITLSQETGEIANLVVEEYGMGVYLSRRMGDQAVDIDTYVGQRVHLHSNALGKVVLAHLQTSRVEEIVDYRGLPEVTENTITDKQRLFEELETIRDRGYATEDGERITGLRSVAAPVLDRDDNVLGSISVAAPTNRMIGERLEEVIPSKVQSTTNVVELNYKHA